MEVEGEMVDHYRVLGLPSGEEGARLTEKEISKAYRVKALVLHPDKRPDDPNAHANFQKLKSSYEILKDDKARKLFDDLLRVRREKLQRDREFDAKRRRMVSDLEERERAAAPPTDARKEEERIKKKLQEEIARIRAMHMHSTNAANANANATRQGTPPPPTVGPDRSRALKVRWEKCAGDYTATRLREIFQEFGQVEDVVIRNTGNKKPSASALVVMASKDAALAATAALCGDSSNPLLVLPLEPPTPTPAAPSIKPQEPVVSHDVDASPIYSHLVGSAYQDFEDSIMEKLRKVYCYYTTLLSFFILLCLCPLFYKLLVALHIADLL